MPKHDNHTVTALLINDNYSLLPFGKRAIACLLFGICLEIATLKGARLSSPLVSGDWVVARVVVFWVLAFVILNAYCLGVSTGHIRGITVLLSENCRALAERKKAVFLSLAISILFTLTIYLIIKNNHNDFRLAIICFATLLSLLLIVLTWSDIKLKLEYLFLLIAVPFGLCYCLVMPFIPEISWDGQIHYRNANCLSFLINAEFTQADLLMADANAVTALGLLSSGDVSAVWNPKQDIDSLNQAQQQVTSLDLAESIVKCSTFSTPLNANEIYFSAGVIGVLPQAIGLWVGRLLGMKIIGRLLVARISSLLFYIFTVFYGLKSLKNGKLLISALALLVTPLLMASNFSYDPWCYALFIFSVCHFVGKLQEGICSLGTYDVLVILSSFTLGCLAKAVYFPLALVLLFTPRKYFSESCSKKRVRLLIGLSVSFLIASFVIPTLVVSLSGTEVPDSRAQIGVSPSGQIKFAFTHPFAFAGTILSFAFSFFSTIPITASLGSYFPYLYTTPAILGCLSWVLVIGALLFDCNDEEFSFGLTLRGAAGLSLIFSLFLSMAALYAAFTPVGLNSVLGFQWRYLIPLYPSFFLIVASLPTKVSELLYGCRFHKVFPAVFVCLEFLYQFINLYFGFIVNLI